MFLLIMVPTSQEFNVPLTAFVLSVTLWLRLVGEVGSGWLAGRVGRKNSADDLDPMVFARQSGGWILTDVKLLM